MATAITLAAAWHELVRNDTFFSAVPGSISIMKKLPSPSVRPRKEDL